MGLPNWFDNNYAVAEKDCRAIQDYVREQGIRTVLEFGPGRSTLAFQQAGCEVWTAEYDDQWLLHYQKLFSEHDRIHLLRYDNVAKVSIPDLNNRRFDLAFVDSPRGQDRVAGLPSRLSTTRLALAHADRVLLHNSERSSEQATLHSLRSPEWHIHYPWRTPKLALFTKYSAHANAMTSSSQSDCYDFAHWPSLPKVSCHCITYGRPNLLEEAIESFLRQDYPGERELVILNDLPGQELVFDHPLVRMVNLPYRLRTIGEKRNTCVALCTGQILFPWDDDDISLPHRISYSLQQMVNHTYFKSDRFWFWRNREIDAVPRHGIAHAMGCWSFSFFDSAGGYPAIQSGQDTGLEDRMAGKWRVVESTPLESLYYIYRYPGTGSYHLSAHGYGQGYHEAARFVEQKQVGGIYYLKPAWRQDYPTLVQAAVQQAASTASA